MSAEAGGPLLYMSTTFATTKAGFEALMPEVNDVEDELLIEGTDEVQTVTLEDATGGTFTLTYSGQTTSNIAYNAAAATVQSNLEALSNLAPGDVVVTGSAGGPYTCTFGGTLGDQNVAEMTASGANLTGEGAGVSVATTVPGVACAWTALAPIEDECAIKLVEKIGEIRALDRGHKTEGVVEDRGVESVEVKYTDAGLEAYARVCQGSTLIPVSAAASQIGQNVLKFGSAPTALTYVHLMLYFPTTAAGHWRVCFVLKAAVRGDRNFQYNNKKFVLPTTFDVYAHEGFTRDEDLMIWYEKTADKSA